MHNPWYMVGTDDAGAPEPPIMLVDGQPQYLITDGIGPIETTIQAVPPGYTLTYKMDVNVMPAEPAHIDDGIRKDSGVDVVTTNLPDGAWRRIVARTFDPMGILAPSAATHGQYRTYPFAIVFDPPSGHVVPVPSLSVLVSMNAPEGWLICMQWAAANLEYDESVWPGPHPLPTNPLHGWRRRHITYGAFQMYKYGSIEAAFKHCIGVRVWSDRGNGQMYGPFLAWYRFEPWP